MTNPFERDDITYLVLINGEGQYSIWPSYVDVPAGWSTARDADARKTSLDYIEKLWTDMRPNSLVAKSSE
jgi:MbtH protein